MIKYKKKVLEMILIFKFFSRRIFSSINNTSLEYVDFFLILSEFLLVEIPVVIDLIWKFWNEKKIDII